MSDILSVHTNVLKEIKDLSNIDEVVMNLTGRKLKQLKPKYIGKAGYLLKAIEISGELVGNYYEHKSTALDDEIKIQRNATDRLERLGEDTHYVDRKLLKLLREKSELIHRYSDYMIASMDLRVTTISK